METMIQPQIGDFPFAGESRAAFEALQRWKGKLLDYAVANPFEALVTVVAGGALVFYLAEKEVNDRVRSYTDALHYISTCLSVGYANIFPLTQTGKLVAAIVMMIGPSMTAWLLEGRLIAREATAGDRERDLAPLLEAILQELQQQRKGPA